MFSDYPTAFSEPLPLWEAAMQEPCMPPAEDWRARCAHCSPEMLRILEVLAEHLGRQSAITAYAIAIQAGIGDDEQSRETRGGLVRSILRAHLDGYLPWIIVADDRGFYRADDGEDGDQELRHYFANLGSRACGIVERMQFLARQCDRAGRAHVAPPLAAVDRLHAHATAVRPPRPG